MRRLVRLDTANWLVPFVGGYALLGSTPAHAYLGPGMGAGTVGVILGIIAAFFLALFALIWYPFKRMLTRRRQRRQVRRTETDPDAKKEGASQDTAN